jgi:serine/threonine protein kinase
MLSEHKYSLPAGFRLGQYVIVQLLGHGGFGLTYLADDTNLHRKVAIKELLPIDFAIRETDGTTVVARSQRDRVNLEWARQRFVEEGRTLAAFHHPSILHVYDIFELHGTAYLVTHFIEGRNFEDWLRDGRAIHEEEILPVVNSLLEALQLVHEQGFLHRDIKPENILMERKSSHPILIDFGNARMATGVKTSNMTAVLSRGYAPFEQYQTKSRQGPFTDIYALGGVLYRAISGAAPDDALDRLEEDKIRVLRDQRIPGYTPKFLATIDKALQMRREDRWQSCEEWKAALRAPGGASAPAPVASHALQPPIPRPRLRTKLIFAMAGLATLLLVVGARLFTGIPSGHDDRVITQEGTSDTLATPLASISPSGTPVPASPGPERRAPVAPSPDPSIPGIPSPVTPAPVIASPTTPAPIVVSPATPAPVIARPATPTPNIAETRLKEAAIRYIESGNAESIDDELAPYADRVDFYGEGIKTKAQIRMRLASLRKLWPTERRYGYKKILSLFPEDGTDVGTAVIAYTYELRNNAKTRSGDATSIIKFKNLSSDPEVVLVNEFKTDAN